MSGAVLAVDDVQLVQGVERQEDLGRVELASALGAKYCSSERRSLRESSPKSYPPGQYSRTK